MRMTWTSGMAAVACVAMMAACGGTDKANEDRPAQDSPGAQTQVHTVDLTGCVATGPGAHFVLESIELGDRQRDPQADLQQANGIGITEGSYVRLTGGDAHDLSGYMGQRVSLSGTVVDSGTNTIGTSGTSGVQTPSGDRSQAATDEHHAEKVQKEAGGIAQHTMANGRAAEIRVERIEPTGERCGGANAVRRGGRR